MRREAALTQRKRASRYFLCSQEIFAFSLAGLIGRSHPVQSTGFFFLILSKFEFVLRWFLKFVQQTVAFSLQARVLVYWSCLLGAYANGLNIILLILLNRGMNVIKKSDFYLRKRGGLFGCKAKKTKSTGPAILFE